MVCLPNRDRTAGNDERVPRKHGIVREQAIGALDVRNLRSTMLFARLSRGIVAGAEILAEAQDSHTVTLYLMARPARVSSFET